MQDVVGHVELKKFSGVSLLANSRPKADSEHCPENAVAWYASRMIRSIDQQQGDVADYQHPAVGACAGKRPAKSSPVIPVSR